MKDLPYPGGPCLYYACVPFLFVSLVCSNVCRFYKNGEWQEVVTDTRIPCAHHSKSNVRALYQHVPPLIFRFCYGRNSVVHLCLRARIALKLTNIVLTCLPALSLLLVLYLKGDGALLGHKLPGGPTPMYGHGLNLNEQWVSMLEKVHATLTFHLDDLLENIVTKQI